MALRCVIVDDNAGFLHAATALLEQEGLQVIGTASNADDAVARVAELHPDVTLLDIDLGGESGFDLAARLAGEPDSRPGALILISTNEEEDFADLVESSAAVGFITKATLSARSIERLVGAPDGPRTRG